RRHRLPRRSHGSRTRRWRLAELLHPLAERQLVRLEARARWRDQGRQRRGQRLQVGKRRTGTFEGGAKAPPSSCRRAYPPTASEAESLKRGYPGRAAEADTGRAIRHPHVPWKEIHTCLLA